MKKGDKLYWFCQVIGWGSLVGIETINYTFFIVGKFNIEYVVIFSYSAIVGLFSSHLYKKIVCRTTLFQKPTSTIWLVALTSTLILSIWLTIVNFIPSFVSNYSESINQLSFIAIFGSVVNWMRYVAVWIIIYFMYRLLERNRSIEENNLRSENFARLTELELLKTQLNPHFLFNALNSIKALVTIDPEKSKDAIVKLSELLRFTLNYGLQPLIPLHDEMLEVKKYLSLEQIRFGERFKVLYEISDNTFSKLIPPAIILTLAENSIKHGIANQTGSCTLVITSELNEDELIIQTTNPGSLNNKSKDGIGVRNIKKRLESLFGSKAWFSISENDGDVIVTIKIQYV